MASVSQKRKRVVLSIQQKLEIIEKLEKGHLVKVLAKDYGIGEQTVRDLKKKKNELISFACASDSSSGMKKRKTMKKSTYDELDKAMVQWFSQQRAQGNPINGLICAEKAKFFFEALGLEGNFDASSGWLTRFKQRHGIRELQIQGESLSGDTAAAEQFHNEFNDFVLNENLLPEQVYNVDESGVYWKCLPTKTLAFESEKSAKGHKVSKERFTAMCCANATGDHKLKMLVIGKAKKPRSFKGTVATNLPVVYYNSARGWMNQEIFKQWFDQHFVPQVREYLKSKGLPQKAVLVLDNAPSHPNEMCLKSDDGKIFVKYLPPNVTALIQPMDQGVLACVKRNYRTSVLRTFIEEGNDLKTFFKNFSLLDAIYECSAAWEKVRSSTLTKSWKKIFPDISEDEDFAGFDQAAIDQAAAELARIANHVEGGEAVDQQNIIEWFQCDNDVPAFETLTDDEILRYAQGEELADDATDDAGAEEEGEGQENNAITHGAARHHVECLLDYLEGQTDSLLCDKLTLRKLRSIIIKKESAAKRQKTLTEYFQRV
jgi:hypothetical protein